MPHPTPKKVPVRSFKRIAVKAKAIGPVALSALVLAAGFFAVPAVLSVDLHLAENTPKPAFPVTVDPIARTIVEDPAVEEILKEDNPKLVAAAGLAGNVFALLAGAITDTGVYRTIAGAVGADTTFVTVLPGYREEEAAAAFGSALGWTRAERAAFLKQLNTTPPTLTEGEIVPGTYAVPVNADFEDVQALLNDRFSREVLSRYQPEAANVVPLEDALTIASMLERETRDPAEMRMISGIIWNRLFDGMNLQIDATLQYAKASQTNTKSWWPKVVPNDKYLKSSYNTYKNKGLPPGPIASPSTEAIIAALNPKKTDCLFYFHDSEGEFYCSPTYEGHVAMLKQKYGRGK